MPDSLHLPVQALGPKSRLPDSLLYLSLRLIRLQAGHTSSQSLFLPNVNASPKPSIPRHYSSPCSCISDCSPDPTSLLSHTPDLFPCSPLWPLFDEAILRLPSGVSKIHFTPSLSSTVYPWLLPVSTDWLPSRAYQI